LSGALEMAVPDVSIQLGQNHGMHRFKIEAARFTLVGAANFVLTFVVFTVMLKSFRVNYLLSLAAAWIVGMLFSYVLNFVWVFQPEQPLRFRAPFVKFFLASALSVALNMLMLKYIVEHTAVDPFYVQMALTVFIVVLNFSTAKFWSFRRSGHSASDEVSP
jgi:putative flippase GtrA